MPKMKTGKQIFTPEMTRKLDRLVRATAHLADSDPKKFSTSADHLRERIIRRIIADQKTTSQHMVEINLSSSDDSDFVIQRQKVPKHPIKKLDTPPVGLVPPPSKPSQTTPKLERVKIKCGIITPPAPKTEEPSNPT